MESNISLELAEENRSQLPKWWLVITLLLLLSSLINFVYVKDIFFVSEGRPEDFDFKNFLIYNLGVKWALYPFKFIGLAGLMMMGAFLFKVEKIRFSAILKIVLLAELIKYLPELLRIIWFTFIDYDSLVGYDMKEFNDNLSLNGLFGLTRGDTLYPLLGYLSMTNALYIMAVAQLLKMATNKSFIYHLRWFGITYGISLLLLGLFYVVLAL